MMEKHFIYLLAAIALLCACQPMGDDIELALVDSTQSECKCSCERQTIRVAFDCNRSWTVSSPEEWIELDPVKGSEGEGQYLAVTVAANTTLQYRTAQVCITAGDRELVFTVKQEPILTYLINENFDDRDYWYEKDLPSGWYTIDSDGDSYGWRCCRDEEMEESFAYSASYDEDREMARTPDNWMVTPRFVVREPGFSVKWDSKSGDPEYPGDKYEVWVAAYEDGYSLVLHEKLCEEVTTDSTELTHHEYNLDRYIDIRICIAFRHYESRGLSRVLITNVEVSNR